MKIKSDKFNSTVRDIQRLNTLVLNLEAMRENFFDLYLKDDRNKYDDLKVIHDKIDGLIKEVYNEAYQYKKLSI